MTAITGAPSGDIDNLGPSGFGESVTHSAMDSLARIVVPQPVLRTAVRTEGPTPQQKIETAMNTMPKDYRASAPRIDAGAFMKDPASVSKQHGALRADAAQQGQQQLAATIKAALQESAGPVSQPGGMPSGNSGSSLLMSAIKNIGPNLIPGPAGIAVAVVMAMHSAVSSVEGQGTLKTFNQPGSAFASAPKLRGRAGYDMAVLTPPPAPAAPTQAAPMMGPGKGAAGFDAGRLSITASLDRMALKIAEESPAGKVMHTMKEDGEHTASLLKKHEKGVDATADNVLAAQNMGMDLKDQGLKIQTFKMA